MVRQSHGVRPQRPPSRPALEAVVVLGIVGEVIPAGIRRGAGWLIVDSVLRESVRLAGRVEGGGSASSTHVLGVIEAVLERWIGVVVNKTGILERVATLLAVIEDEQACREEEEHAQPYGDADDGGKREDAGAGRG